MDKKIQDIQKGTPSRSESLDRSRKKRLFSELSPVKSDEDTLQKSLNLILERLDRQDLKLHKLDSLEKTQSQMNTKLDKLCEMEIALNATIIRIDEFEKKFCDMDKNVESLWEELNDVKKQIADNTNSAVPDLKAKESELCYLQRALIEQKKDIKQEYIRLKDYSQRHNLLFYGVPESKGENCTHIVDDIISRHMGLSGAWRQIDKSHRYGTAQHDGRARPIIVRFTSHSAKELTLSRSSGLWRTQFSVRPHLSDETQRTTSVLQKAQRIGKSTDPSCRVVGGRLMYKGKSFNIENLHKSDIPVHKIHQRETSDSVGFLGYLSPLSNFHKCEVRVNGVSYRSVEHFYQMRRAALCNEHELVAKLHVMDTAREVKQAVNDFKRDQPGKLVLSENEDLDIMKTGLTAKFADKALQTFLLETGDKTIIECNADDKFWSCGLGLDNPSFPSRTRWKGKNQLGKLLQQIRSDLRNSNRE